MATEKKFQEYLNLNNILCRLSVNTRDEVFKLLLDTFKRHFDGLDEALAASGIAEREKQLPTVIAPGLAVPHARVEGITEPLVALASIPAGIDFQSEMGPVKLVVMVLSPLDQPNVHMQLLAALAQSLAKQEKISEVVDAKTPVEVMRALSGLSEAEMPDYLKASDVMRRNVPTVLENDTVRTALARFAATGATELVVVDLEGDLRGILSLEDLLKNSLPEHLLWMEDLSPISQFQPFAEMLSTAGDAKVADLMHEEFISVDSNVPAIQLAKLFLVNQVKQLIITGSAGKLAGVVDFREFCAKVFWE